jgi:hypothetical protein
VALSHRVAYVRIDRAVERAAERRRYYKQEHWQKEEHPAQRRSDFDRHG